MIKNLLLGALIVVTCGCGEDNKYTPVNPPPNYAFYECICDQESIGRSKYHLFDKEGYDAYWIVIGSGGCPACKSETEYMVYVWNKWMAHSNVFVTDVLISDDNWNSNINTLSSFCCEYKKDYGIDFMMSIDPGGISSTDSYNFIPYNLILDKNFEIVYEQEGFTGGEAGVIKVLLQSLEDSSK